jgi:hypothetical protein
VVGAHSLLADNIAASVVGLVLATAFRFAMSRYWVCGDARRGARKADPSQGSEPATVQVDARTNP